MSATCYNCLADCRSETTRRGYPLWRKGQRICGNCDRAIRAAESYKRLTAGLQQPADAGVTVRFEADSASIPVGEITYSKGY